MLQLIVIKNQQSQYSQYERQLLAKFGNIRWIVTCSDMWVAEKESQSDGRWIDYDLLKTCVVSLEEFKQKL